MGSPRHPGPIPGSEVWPQDTPLSERGTGHQSALKEASEWKKKGRLGAEVLQKVKVPKLQTEKRHV